MREGVIVAEISRRLNIPVASIRRMLQAEGLKPLSNDEEPEAAPEPESKPLGVKCKYPGCRLWAMTRFALVPLCQGHGNTIRMETSLYYMGKGDAERPHYQRIKPLIRWAQK